MRHRRPLSTLVLLKHLSVNVSVPAGEPLRSALQGRGSTVCHLPHIKHNLSECARPRASVFVRAFVLCFDSRASTWSGGEILEMREQVGQSSDEPPALSKFKQKDIIGYFKEQEMSVYIHIHHCYVVYSSLVIFKWSMGTTNITKPYFPLWCFSTFRSISRHCGHNLETCVFFFYQISLLTTITAPAPNQLPEFCGLITIALLPCDTLCMMKPSREAEWSRRGAELKCCNRYERWTNRAPCN